MSKVEHKTIPHIRKLERTKKSIIFAFVVLVFSVLLGSLLSAAMPQPVMATVSGVPSGLGTEAKPDNVKFLDNIASGINPFGQTELDSALAEGGPIDSRWYAKSYMYREAIRTCVNRGSVGLQTGWTYVWEQGYWFGNQWFDSTTVYVPISGYGEINCYWAGKGTNDWPGKIAGGTNITGIWGTAPVKTYSEDKPGRYPAGHTIICNQNNMKNQGMFWSVGDCNAKDAKAGNEFLDTGSDLPYFMTWYQNNIDGLGLSNSAKPCPFALYRDKNSISGKNCIFEDIGVSFDNTTYLNALLFTICTEEAYYIYYDNLGCASTTHSDRKDSYQKISQAILDYVRVKRCEQNIGNIDWTTVPENLQKELCNKVIAKAPDDPGKIDPGKGGISQDPTNSKCYNATDNVAGWFTCPALKGLAGVIDGFIGTITGGLEWNFLIPGEQPTGTNGFSGQDASQIIQKVWSSFLPIANIVMAVVFLIIIYSTATSVGLSNYSIKKILPRLILVAISVNLSFYICAALADISNIVGKGAFDLIINNSGVNIDVSFFDKMESFWQDVVAGLIIIIVLLTSFSTMFLALLVILIAIAARQIILMILVIIAPVAFALYLLPNTEKWFKKWFDTFIQLLMVYPIFMVMWAGSRLILAISRITDVPGVFDFLLGIFATLAPAIMIIPIFKMSGGLMGKMTGAIQSNKALQGLSNLAGGALDRARFGAANKLMDSKNPLAKLGAGILGGDEMVKTILDSSSGVTGRNKRGVRAKFAKGARGLVDRNYAAQLADESDKEDVARNQKYWGTELGGSEEYVRDFIEGRRSHNGRSFSKLSETDRLGILKHYDTMAGNKLSDMLQGNNYKGTMTEKASYEKLMVENGGLLKRVASESTKLPQKDIAAFVGASNGTNIRDMNWRYDPNSLSAEQTGALGAQSIESLSGFNKSGIDAALASGNIQPETMRRFFDSIRTGQIKMSSSDLQNWTDRIGKMSGSNADAFKKAMGALRSPSERVSINFTAPTAAGGIAEVDTTGIINQLSNMAIPGGATSGTARQILGAMRQLNDSDLKQIMMRNDKINAAGITDADLDRLARLAAREQARRP